MKVILRRWRSIQVRRKKHKQFMQRWNAACNKLWSHFRAKSPSEESFSWMERNHARLMKISAKWVSTKAVKKSKKK